MVRVVRSLTEVSSQQNRGRLSLHSKLTRSWSNQLSRRLHLKRGQTRRTVIGKHNPIESTSVVRDVGGNASGEYRGSA
jgi:hypothetical protein